MNLKKIFHLRIFFVLKFLNSSRLIENYMNIFFSAHIFYTLDNPCLRRTIPQTIFFSLFGLIFQISSSWSQEHALFTTSAGTFFGRLPTYLFRSKDSLFCFFLTQISNFIIYKFYVGKTVDQFPWHKFVQREELIWLSLLHHGYKFSPWPLKQVMMLERAVFFYQHYMFSHLLLVSIIIRQIKLWPPIYLIRVFLNFVYHKSVKLIDDFN